MNQQLFLRLLDVALLAAARSGGRVRVAVQERDETTDFDPEAQEHIKIDGRREGRDLQLYASMADIAGVGAALSDFALVVVRYEACQGCMRRSWATSLGWASYSTNSTGLHGATSGGDTSGEEMAK